MVHADRLHAREAQLGLGGGESLLCLNLLRERPHLGTHSTRVCDQGMFRHMYECRIGDGGSLNAILRYREE